VQATAEKIANRLDAIASLHRENDSFWAELAPPHPQGRRADAEMSWLTT
jgi:hypothetical protein